jgi:hypothetical protein
VAPRLDTLRNLLRTSDALSALGCSRGRWRVPSRCSQSGAVALESDRGRDGVGGAVPPETRYARLQGDRIAYQVLGEGPPTLS